MSRVSWGSRVIAVRSPRRWLDSGGRARVGQRIRAHPACRRDPRKTSTFVSVSFWKQPGRPAPDRSSPGSAGRPPNDGGTGMASALATGSWTTPGANCRGGGSALSRLDRIDATGLNAGWAPVKVMVACDVTNPLTGPPRCELRVWTSEGRGPAHRPAAGRGAWTPGGCDRARFQTNACGISPEQAARRHWSGSDRVPGRSAGARRAALSSRRAASTKSWTAPTS